VKSWEGFSPSKRWGEQKRGGWGGEGRRVVIQRSIGRKRKSEGENSTREIQTKKQKRRGGGENGGKRRETEGGKMGGKENLKKGRKQSTIEKERVDLAEKRGKSLNPNSRGKRKIGGGKEKKRGEHSKTTRGANAKRNASKTPRSLYEENHHT